MPLVPMRILLGSRRRERLRSGRVQRQQHGANPGDHGGRQGNQFAGHRAGVARSALVLPGQLPPPSDDRRGGALSADSHRHAPGSRQQPRRRATARSRTGFTSVMMDGSLKEDGKTPADYDYNVRVTREVVEAGPPPRRQRRRRARLSRFAGTRRRRTGGRPRRDRPAFARSVAHRSRTRPSGSWPRPASMRWPWRSAPATAPTNSQRSRRAKCWPWSASRRFTGGCRTRTWSCTVQSSVPQELQDIINKYGGKMPQTWGVPVEEIQRGIKHGVRKINVDTDNRMAITGAIRKVLWEHPDKFDPRDYLKPARDAMKKVCIERMIQFGQAGNASKIKPVSLDEMAKRYQLRWSSGNGPAISRAESTS